MIQKINDGDGERAVSPVIGVILMVAITVILAAVIAAFVLDLGPTETDPQAAIDVEGDGTTEVEVTLLSMAEGDGIAVVGNDTGQTGTFADTAPENDGTYIDTVSTTGDSISLDATDVIDGTTAGHTIEFDVIVYSGAEPDAVEHVDLQAIDDDDAITVAVIDGFTLENNS